MSLGNRIKAGVKAIGISQAALARKTGQNPQDLQKIISGQTKTSKHLPEIAKVRLDGDDVVLSLYRPEPPENDDPAGFHRRGSYIAQSWLTKAHGKRTVEVVMRGSGALRLRSPAAR